MIFLTTATAHFAQLRRLTIDENFHLQYCQTRSILIQQIHGFRIATDCLGHITLKDDNDKLVYQCIRHHHLAFGHVSDGVNYAPNA
jgi:hypothetical protein